MTSNAPHVCELMEDALQDTDIPVVYGDKFREYGIRILDGGSAILEISFCPFCGLALPRSLRDQWFDRLRSLGLEEEDPRVPLEMRDGTWWRKPGTPQ